VLEALMTVFGMTLVWFFALGALRQPAVINWIFLSFSAQRRCRTGLIWFGVVAAIAFLAGDWITNVTMAVAIAATTGVGEESRAAEVASHATLTLSIAGEISAIEANCGVSGWTFVDDLFELLNRSIELFEVRWDANRWVTIAEVGAGFTSKNEKKKKKKKKFFWQISSINLKFNSPPINFHMKPLAFLTLGSFRVVLTFQTFVKLIWSSAIGMTRALASYRAIVSNIAEITLADIWMNASAMEAAHFADRLTIAVDILVAIATNALKTMLEVDAGFCRWVAIVMTICALILGRAF
jgi:hypothetical protein